MPAIGFGVHELRLKDRSGVYRVVYALIVQGTVHVLHGFKKTAQATPRRNIELAQRRLKEIKERTLKEAKR
jgi:phage-related protein